MEPIKSELPKSLTNHQAAAWVTYRTIRAVAISEDPDRYAGLKLGELPRVGDLRELRTALREGTLVAQGWHRNGLLETISPAAWTRLPIAPLYLERQYPYSQILIDRDDLLRLFPDLAVRNRRGRPTKYNWDWVRDAAKAEKAMGCSKLADVLISRYEAEFNAKIGVRTMESQLRRWGYGQ